MLAICSKSCPTPAHAIGTGAYVFSDHRMVRQMSATQDTELCLTNAKPPSADVSSDICSNLCPMIIQYGVLGLPSTASTSIFICQPATCGVALGFGVEGSLVLCLPYHSGLLIVHKEAFASERFPKDVSCSKGFSCLPHQSELACSRRVVVDNDRQKVGAPPSESY